MCSIRLQGKYYGGPDGPPFSFLFAFFHLDIDLEEVGKLFLQITAVARYRLWINGKPVLSGPCKGDRYRQYYDGVDVSDYLKKMFELWRVLPEKGCTTCPEVPVNSRSECHAWSAQPIYEFIHHILGLCIEEAGWEKISISPDFSVLKNMNGQLVTLMGILKFMVKKTNEKVRIELDIPKGINSSLCLGREKVILHAGLNVYEKSCIQ